jgi:hypothetical protein
MRKEGREEGERERKKLKEGMRNIVVIKQIIL